MTVWRDAAVPVPGGTLALSLAGEGPALLFAPSFGRSARDFGPLAEALATRGYRVLLPEPRGIAPTTAPADGVTQDRLADDLAAAADFAEAGPVVAVGHAFGNRLVRTLAHRHPAKVRALVLMAAGGSRPIAAPIRAALETCFDLDLPDAVRLAAVRIAFFARGNDPAVWRGGWFPEAAGAQMRAADAVLDGAWTRAGERPIFILQPAEDAVAPPAAAAELAACLGTVRAVVTVDGAGHALLPERPEAVEHAMVSFLAEIAKLDGAGGAVGESR